MKVWSPWLIDCMFEAVRTFENSGAKSTCYDSNLDTIEFLFN